MLGDTTKFIYRSRDLQGESGTNSPPLSLYLSFFLSFFLSLSLSLSLSFFALFAVIVCSVSVRIINGFYLNDGLSMKLENCVTSMTKVRF